ncbi:hypothetical protein MNV49_001049 [Pseudohyphozyma bogoriensis]|nr:hypothetical protein MNV49_001049 [Pseudohyphozyma bogoriensis]
MCAYLRSLIAARDGQISRLERKLGASEKRADVEEKRATAEKKAHTETKKKLAKYENHFGLFAKDTNLVLSHEATFSYSGTLWVELEDFQTYSQSLRAYRQQPLIFPWRNIFELERDIEQEYANLTSGGRMSRGHRLLYAAYHEWENDSDVRRRAALTTLVEAVYECVQWRRNGPAYGRNDICHANGHLIRKVFVEHPALTHVDPTSLGHCVDRMSWRRVSRDTSKPASRLDWAVDSHLDVPADRPHIGSALKVARGEPMSP